MGPKDQFQICGSSLKPMSVHIELEGKGCLPAVTRNVGQGDSAQASI